MGVIEARRARRALDARLADFGASERYAVPQSGWVRAIRDALGMTAAELGARIGVSHVAVVVLEQSERNGTARLETLRRAADALDCKLVYAFIPNRGLEASVRTQAERAADNDLGRVQHTMALEDQQEPIGYEAREDVIRQLMETRGLWSRRS